MITTINQMFFSGRNCEKYFMYVISFVPCMVEMSGSQSVVLGPAASASLGNLLEVQILKLQSKESPDAPNYAHEESFGY